MRMLPIATLPAEDRSHAARTAAGVAPARAAAATLVTSALLLLAACTTAEQPAGEGVDLSANPTYKAHCVHCHGPQGGGITGLGTDLRVKGEYWNAEELLAYVRDPGGYAAEKMPRLRESVRMTPLPASVPDEEARELVALVLEAMGR